VPFADATEGLEANVMTLVSNVVEPVVSSTGTRLAVLTLPSGNTYEADIHVIGLDLQSVYQTPDHSHAVAEGRLLLPIPTGRLA
jgi:hypothetical protein